MKFHASTAESTSVLMAVPLRRHWITSLLQESLKSVLHRDIPCWEKSLLLPLVCCTLRPLIFWDHFYLLRCIKFSFSWHLKHLWKPPLCCFLFTALWAAKWFPMENRTAPLNTAGCLGAQGELICNCCICLGLKVTAVQESLSPTGHWHSLLKELAPISGMD